MVPFRCFYKLRHQFVAFSLLKLFICVQEGGSTLLSFYCPCEKAWLKKVSAVPWTLRDCIFFTLSTKPFSLCALQLVPLSCFWGGEQVRSLRFLIRGVINSPMTKWTFYEYSGSVSASWETILSEPLTTPFGDADRFLGECGSSAVCLGLHFQAAESSFAYSVCARMQNSTPISPLAQKQWGLPLETPAKISFCLCRTQWFRHHAN